MRHWPYRLSIGLVIDGSWFDVNLDKKKLINCNNLGQVIHSHCSGQLSPSSLLFCRCHYLAGSWVTTHYARGNGRATLSFCLNLLNMLLNQDSLSISLLLILLTAFSLLILNVIHSTESTLLGSSCSPWPEYECCRSPKCYSTLSSWSCCCIWDYWSLSFTGSPVFLTWSKWNGYNGLKSYVTSQSFKVSLNGFESSVFQLRYGAPQAQGSGLGPLLITVLPVLL